MLCFKSLTFFVFTHSPLAVAFIITPSIFSRMSLWLFENNVMPSVRSSLLVMMLMINGCLCLGLLLFLSLSVQWQGSTVLANITHSCFIPIWTSKVWEMISIDYFAVNSFIYTFKNTDNFLWESMPPKDSPQCISAHTVKWLFRKVTA